ncbi:MAG: GntR family transcriptional regulator, partial [Actinomycetales bacterium]|nr:GntR family transcriptional regulator [Actinomycetales bacterium]
MPSSSRPATLALGEISGAADLVGAIIDRIADGALADGDRLPSTRALAEQTGLSRGTVVRAFDELAAAGFVASEHGSGTRVSRGAVQAARAGAHTRGSAGAHTRGSAGAHTRGSKGDEAEATLGSTGDAVEASSSSPPPEPRRGRSPRDLRPGTPDAALVDGRAWRSAVRAAAAQGLAGLNPWEEPSPTVRAALSVHLRRHRGIAGADPLLFDSSRSAVAALCAAFVAEQPEQAGRSGTS